MVIPRPRSMERRDGVFALTSRTAVRGPDDVVAMVRRELRPPTGFPLAGAGNGEDVIEIGLDRAFGAETYRLSITPDMIRITAGGPAGAFYAVQTLRQLLPPAIYRRAPLAGVTWEAPCVEIEDGPRFCWRGAHLDVGRHFMPKPFLFRFIDLLALHKYNVLHLHLTEDQGWRFESVKYPRLIEVGAWRRETNGDGTPHGGFYSQDDLRELVAYAAARFVTIVPEIDMPGHMQAAVAAYPELGNFPDRPVQVATTWGILEAVLNLEPATIQFCKDILAEVMEVFPGRYVHIGGDECPTTQWRESAMTRQRIDELGIGGVEEAQGWFTRQIAALLDEHGRRLVGWDEIMDHGDVSGATVMAWRSREHGIDAVRRGHDVVMAPTIPTYFDYYSSEDPDEPRALGRLVTLEQVYGFDPVASELSDREGANVLGTQFQVWTEHMPGPRQVEYMSFPRAVALAEVAWSYGERDWPEFLTRLRPHLTRLDALSVNYRPLEGPRPWQRGGTGARRRPDRALA